ncbi:MAG: flavin reductase [Geminicoccaceae bacterium]
MDLRLADLAARDRYKLLTSLVVPRPIAFVTSQDADGLANAAPYSFFNVFSDEPPLVVIGIGRRAGGALKDTARNIEAKGEFVINLVDEELAAAMNVAAVDFPLETSEPGPAGLGLAASIVVRLAVAHRRGLAQRWNAGTTSTPGHRHRPPPRRRRGPRRPRPGRSRRSWQPAHRLRRLPPGRPALRQPLLRGPRRLRVGARELRPAGVAARAGSRRQTCHGRPRPPMLPKGFEPTGETVGMVHCDLVIKGGRVATATDVLEADIGITGETVVAIAKGLPTGRLEIDARGKIVTPGGVDSHCHIEQLAASGLMNADTFETATVSAAMGGTTSRPLLPPSMSA